MRRRHYGLVASFVLMVIAPLVVTMWYLYTVSLDQYASRIGFSVQKEEVGSAVEILGGITELSGSSSSDTDILYEFIQSQQMVREVNDRLDLAAIYQHEGDPVFALASGKPSIEALVAYWHRMVHVSYDSSSKLIEVVVRAFSAEEAHAISQAIYDASSEMINELSAIAREDTTAYAREELDGAIAQLKEARRAMTDFRSRTQIVDPQADVQGRMGLVNTLQGQLAEALIELDLLRQGATSEDDPRVVQARKRVEVIRDRIADERARFGEGGGGTSELEDYSRLVAQFEDLAVDVKFAEESYVSARGAYDAAVAEAQRKSRYLASYVAPTMPETPEYPQRGVISLLVGVGLFLFWSVATMIFYALRDRK
jgi:capsular polysaccharide transport system permease protein